MRAGDRKQFLAPPHPFSAIPWKRSAAFPHHIPRRPRLHSRCGPMAVENEMLRQLRAGRHGFAVFSILPDIGRRELLLQQGRLSGYIDPCPPSLFAPPGSGRKDGLLRRTGSHPRARRPLKGPASGAFPLPRGEPIEISPMILPLTGPRTRVSFLFFPFDSTANFREKVVRRENKPAARTSYIPSLFANRRDAARRIWHIAGLFGR